MSLETPKRVALVTGSNRGIGLEVCRQLGTLGFRVLLAARNAPAAAEAADSLIAAGLEVSPLVLDVTSQSSVSAAMNFVAKNFGRLDVLVNNAGIGYDPAEAADQADLGAVTATWETNVLGVWLVTQAALPLLRKATPGANVVNVSSEAGSFTSNGYFSLASQPGVAGYAVSKAALNALTVKMANSLSGSGILVNSICPGWTATYPGGAEQGARPVELGAASVVWVAVLPPDGPTGGFFRDGEPLPW